MVFTAYEGGQTRETRVARLRRKEEMKVTAKREKIGVQRHIRIAERRKRKPQTRPPAQCEILRRARKRAHVPAPAVKKHERHAASAGKLRIDVKSVCVKSYVSLRVIIMADASP